jgi:hypothetical protein
MNDASMNSGLKEWARMLFTEHDETIQDIALRTGIDEATIRAWVQDGGWQGIKRSLRTSRVAQLELMYSAIEKLQEKMKDPGQLATKDVDLMLKYTSAIKNLQTETPVSQIIEVFDPFVRWLRRKDPGLAKKIIVPLDAFIKERLNG